MKFLRTTVIFIIALAVLALALPVCSDAAAPRLVLQITVDQLRGDLPARYADRLTERGFRYLMEKGTWYMDAHFEHANTETAVGHATLATGADPSRHGIVANDWIDAATGAFVYNTEDDRHHIIGREAKAHEGVSPRNLLSSTISDEMVVHNAGRSRAFSVSVKDRGAILPGGHVGKAFWFSKSTGEFVTSTYYYDDYPQWVKQWNAAKRHDHAVQQQDPLDTLVDGALITSDLMLAAQADGHEIETVEGLSSPGHLHPIQEAFIESGAIQSGYSTPAMILAAKALIGRNPNPTEDDVRDALSGILDRETGYLRPVHAVLRAAAGKGDRGTGR